MEKRILTLAAFAALCLTSCDNTDIIEANNYAIGNSIRVHAFMDGELYSKASTPAVSETSTSNLLSFYLKAFKNDLEATDTDATADWFNDVYTRTTGTNAFSSANAHYWTLDNKFSFVAIAQDNASCQSFAAASSTTFKYDTLNVNAYKVKIAGSGKSIYDDEEQAVDQEDPCVAIANASAAVTTLGANDVTLTFSHILSRLSVNAGIETNGADISMKIAGYEFRDVFVQGDYTGTSATIGQAAQWTNQVSDTVRYQKDASSFAGSLPENPTPYLASSWSNVIPGKVTPKLVLKVDFYDAAQTTYLGTRFLTSGYDEGNTLPEITFKPGYQYVYNVMVRNAGGTDPAGTDGTDPDKPLDNFKIDLLDISVTSWVSELGGTAEFK